MKSFTLRSQFYIPTHINLIANNPSFLVSSKTKSPSLSIKKPKSSSRITKSPSRIKLSNRPLLIESEIVKSKGKPNKLESLSGDEESHHCGLSTETEKFVSSRYVIVGAVSLGLMMLLMGSDDNQMALAFGPEGPLMEDFWDNMRRYGLYALTVSTGVLYAVFQPLYELLKNPISAILVVTILGGGFYIVTQVVSAMIGITEFSYDYNY
ncbi:hypothetical protein LXL04_034734 [Taraxacum kok-saghyz]